MQLITQTSSITIGTQDYPKNKILFDVNVAKQSVTLKLIEEDKVIFSGRYDEYTDFSGTPFSSSDALVNYLRTALY